MLNAGDRQATTPTTSPKTPSRINVPAVLVDPLPECGELETLAEQTLDVDLKAREKQQEGEPHERQDRHREQASEWLAEAPVLTWMERLSTEQEA